MIKIIVFSDPRAIKCNHGVIYSGQSEWWLRQLAGCVWAEGGREFGYLPRQGDRPPPSEMDPGGPCPRSPPSRLATRLARSGVPGTRLTWESLPGVPQSSEEKEVQSHRLSDAHVGGRSRVGTAGRMHNEQTTLQKEKRKQDCFLEWSRTRIMLSG